MTSPATKWDPASVCPHPRNTSPLPLSYRGGRMLRAARAISCTGWTQDPPCLARNSSRSWTTPEPSGWDEQPRCGSPAWPSTTTSRCHHTRGFILTLSPCHSAVPFPGASQEQLQPPSKVLTLAVGSHVSSLGPPHSLFFLGPGKNA